MRILLDTNRYSDLDAGVPDVQQRYEDAESLVLSVIVLGELKAGFAIGREPERNEAQLRKFLQKPTARILAPDVDTAEIYADILATLRRQGTPIPTNDIWIAAQALQHDLTLDSRDHHFNHVPGLKRV